MNATTPRDQSALLTDLPVTLTAHARQRMAQRNLSCKDIMYTIEHGRIIHRAGAEFVHLGRNDIPDEDRARASVARLEGVTLVMSVTEPIILTVWRNRGRGLRHIRSKRA